MLDEAARVFAGETESKRDMLRAVWPELYNVLYQATKTTERAWGCGFHHGENADGSTPYYPVMGRLWLNGPPACRGCLASRAERPGGYPMERIDPREWKP